MVGDLVGDKRYLRIKIRFNIVAFPLKAGIVYSEETSVARLRHSKFHVRVATVVHAAIEELWEGVFSVDLSRGYIWRVRNSKVRASELSELE